MDSTHKYPSDILPQQGWRQCISASDVISCCKCALLGRKLDGEIVNCIDVSDGEGRWSIYMNALPITSVPNLSCSLLGALFKPHYLHFLPEGTGKQPWTGEETVTDEQITGNYSYFDSVTIVGWSIEKVHHLVLPYKHSFLKQNEYTQFRENAIEIATKRNLAQIYLKEWTDLMLSPTNSQLRIVDVFGEARVNHAPTMLNYWHFTIDLYAAENDFSPLKNASKGWRHNLALNLCDYLRHSFSLITDETDIPVIEDKNLWINE